MHSIPRQASEDEYSGKLRVRPTPHPGAAGEPAATFERTASGRFREAADDDGAPDDGAPEPEDLEVRCFF